MRRWYPGLCAITIVAYVLTPSVAVQGMIGALFHTGLVVTMLAGIRRHRPGTRWPWYALAAQIALFGAGDVAYWIRTIQHQRDAFPSYADVFYVWCYLSLLIGLGGFVRARRAGWDRPLVLDTAILSSGAAMLGWVFVIGPAARTDGLTPLGLAVSVSYPVFDLLALSLLVRLALGTGRRPPAYRILMTGISILLLTDVAYTLLELEGGYQLGGLLDVGWLTTHSLIGAAALHPTMAAVTVPGRRTDDRMISRHRLQALTTASLMAPAVLAIEWIRGRPLDVPVVAGGCVVLFLLVMARLQNLVGMLAEALGTAEAQAQTDQLTGLANRRMFHTRWEGALTAGTGPTALLYVDLDGFKTVNDTRGHETGDAVLEVVAARIRDTIRAGDLVARLGGDEFAVILPGASDDHATQVATRIVAAVAEPIPAPDGPVTVGASIGVITAPAGADPETEIKRADTAMYAAKAAGRGQVCHG
ncbi:MULTISPECIES: GGDEF domain-containing protein [Actinoplanes]|uniref:GGDEF domain-containing protein n=1 Tax=Actinoplanes TaxID=1865 RepID=UPI000697159D|nr:MULTISPECIES: GGDEF domain-containing protein [Actinoplanes]GLY03943.1 hypothetical protein Acsp01_43220 [Actinoplanes sp. NBRC 101535]